MSAYQPSGDVHRYEIVRTRSPWRPGAKLWAWFFFGPGEPEGSARNYYFQTRLEALKDALRDAENNSSEEWAPRAIRSIRAAIREERKRWREVQA